VHAVVTGASSGIGAALVSELVRAGYDVTLVARRKKELERVAREAGGRTHIIPRDLGNADCADDWLDEAETVLGPIDVLVNNAGRLVSGPAASIPLAEVRAVVELDLLVPLALMRAVIPRMLRRGHGAIVNICSTGALGPNPGMVHYCAAKAGLAAASEALHGELRNSNVRVTTVYPGPTRTAMLGRAESRYPATRAVRSSPTASPAALARRIVHGIKRGKARVIYPRVYTLFRWLPALTRWALDRFTPALGPERSA
jgi:short-subunit dehydrogenase